MAYKSSFIKFCYIFILLKQAIIIVSYEKSSVCLQKTNIFRRKDGTTFIITPIRNTVMQKMTKWSLYLIPGNMFCFTKKGRSH